MVLFEDLRTPLKREALLGRAWHWGRALWEGSPPHSQCPLSVPICSWRHHLSASCAVVPAPPPASCCHAPMLWWTHFHCKSKWKAYLEVALGCSILSKQSKVVSVGLIHNVLLWSHWSHEWQFILMCLVPSKSSSVQSTALIAFCKPKILRIYIYFFPAKQNWIRSLPCLFSHLEGTFRHANARSLVSLSKWEI